MSRYILKLTGCVVIDGQVRRPGEEVELTDREARNLLARGKAELLGAAVADQVDANEDVGTDLDTAPEADAGAAVADQVDADADHAPAADPDATTEPKKAKAAPRRSSAKG